MKFIEFCIFCLIVFTFAVSNFLICTEREIVIGQFFSTFGSITLISMYWRSVFGKSS